MTLPNNFFNNDYQEYLWAMRQMSLDSQNSDEKVINISDLNSSELINRRNTDFNSLSEEYATKMLASFVPDEVIYDVNNYKPRVYDVCLLFGDVSGFTNLCEQYTRTTTGGASKLTVVLNNFLGGLIAEVISHGGDILKFSGDAFLSMFKSSSVESLRDAVHLAIDSAVSIQNTCGTYVTDTGLQLKVKLAISCGQVVFSLIGNEKYTHYVCIGQPIFDVKKAEKKAKAGDIIVNYSAWGYIGANEYIFELMNDEIHTKVFNYGINWRAIEELEKRMTAQYLRKIVNDNSKKKVVFTTEEEQDESSYKFSFEDFSVRPCVNMAVKMKLRNDLRKFIFIPAIREVNTDEPLEYLTEMRQVVTVFINVVVYKIEILHYVRIIDTTFKIVTDLVDKGHGNVNKLSLFDKDLMIVALFGLRGFKDELECQNGLICAYICQEEISKLDYVKVCSVGVTTGMAYCGVVGHTLRREYTVIGPSVNKAARLMMAYPAKVVCDRETFLHSKMEYRHFILQEQRTLKGISHTGPVYAFILEPISVKNVENSTPQPLLGRKTEMKLFNCMLENCFEVWQSGIKCGNMYLNLHSVLVIKGKPRQGKTRLLDEIAKYNRNDTPVYKISLSYKDSKFKTIQLIFVSAMGLEESSTKNEIKHQIISLMKSYKIPQVLCCLNTIFKIDFAKSDFYISLSSKEKEKLTKDAFTYLSQTCFPKHSVIVIDNGQFLDDDSWLLLKLMVNLNLFFLVLGVDSNRISSPYFKNFTENNKVRIMELQKIDNWFHAGLICQFLNVQAIPAELEKFIQLRSGGNPGWIESFLVTLKQIHGIVIKHVDESIFKEIGLVKPPSYMIGRKESQDNSSESDIDNWKMYKHSFYENEQTDDHNVDIADGKVVLSNSMAICLIAPGYNLENEDLELSVDVLIMKTFDSLTSYEQLLLKTSSVIGNLFLRDMLLYIMGSSLVSKDAPLAIKKLFEMKVLQCAQGDFSEGVQGLVMAQRSSFVKPSNSTIQCNCIGYPYTDQYLPKYAHCGYIRFTLPIFRDTTYNLLTESQKKEFHAKAMKYLEKETRRCSSCGRGFFYNILGTRTDNDLVNFWKKNRQKNADFGKANRSNSKQSSFLTTSTNKNTKLFAGPDQNNDFLMESNFGIKLIKTLSKRFSLTRTFSFADFSHCQCALILDTMYVQILEHCKEAGEHEKLMHALLEYANLCIELRNLPQALKTLKDAEAFIMENPLIGDNDEEAKWRRPILKGQIKSLTGAAYLEMGQTDEAFQNLNEALCFYGYSFPRTNIGRRRKAFSLKICQSLGLYLTPSVLFGSVQGYDADFANKLSETLSLICHVQMDLNMWKEAELAAMWSLNKALNANTDFCKMCIAFGDMIEIYHRSGKNKIVKALEVHALRLCHRKKGIVMNAKELRAVCKLYSSIFNARIMRSEIDQALHTGYIINRLGVSVHSPLVILKILPVMVFCLAASQRLTDITTLLNDIRYYASEDTDNTGKVWYFALGLIFNLETGYTYVTYEQCKTFFDIGGESLLSVQDSEAEKCFYIVAWLWCLRNDRWNSASNWYIKIHKLISIEKDDSIITMISSLYLLEGLILYLVGKMDNRNFTIIANAHKEVKKLITCVKCITKNCKLVLPRFYHLKAYFIMIKNREEESLKLLSKAKIMAKNYKNELERLWIEHSELAWTHNMSSLKLNFWKDHNIRGNTINYHEAAMNDEMPAGLFSLPIPYYSGSMFF